jgi:PAS domain S-box-containing protein
MKTHKTIIALVGFSLFLIMIIIIISLSNVMTAFSSLIAKTEHVSREIQQLDSVEKTLAVISSDVHLFIMNNDGSIRESVAISFTSAHRMLDAFDAHNLTPGDRIVSAALRNSLSSMETSVNKILSLRDPAGRDHVTAHNLMLQTDSLTAFMMKDIAVHHTEESDSHILNLSNYLLFLKTRVVALFSAIFLASIAFLLGFGIYVRRTLAVPLVKLRKGASEITRGNLDYRIPLHGTSDIASLAEQFNSMADKLKHSHSELEQKLLERTNELAAIDAVALTLSEAGTLKDVLSKSLNKIMDSLSNLEPRGGVFLCDTGGEFLRLTTQKGLLPEFAQREETIRMGECLCGAVARTGEMLVIQDSSGDPRHTRCNDAEPHGHIVLPIKSRGIVLGVIFLYTTKDFSLKPSDIQMLDAIGAQLGLAVENFRFYAEVKQSSEKFWDLFENARDFLFLLDIDGALTAVNHTAEKFLGYSKMELIGKNVTEILTPEGAGIAGKMLVGEGVKLQQMLEFEVVKHDSSHAFLEVSIRRLYKDRVLSGYQISARDITEQKRMHDALVSAERLGAIGQMGIAVRHEINNPLSTVIGNAELLIERYEQKDKDLTARLEVILNNALRIAEITKRMQDIKKEKIVDYLTGIKMTDLK